MSTQVTLTITRGALRGHQFVFTGPTSWTIGRSADCSLQVPTDTRHLSVSRHHCRLDFDPPRVRVTDLGSRNGTYVNGHLLGSRPELARVIDPARRPMPTVTLADGDVIEVGDISFSLRLNSTSAATTSRATSAAMAMA